MLTTDIIVGLPTTEQQAATQDSNCIIDTKSGMQALSTTKRHDD